MRSFEGAKCQIYSIIDEMEELDVAEEMNEDYQLILAAIDQGHQTEADIVRITGLGKETLRYELELLERCGTIEKVPQGGKGHTARGQVKQLYQRVENSNYEVPEGYAMPPSNVLQFNAA